MSVASYLKQPLLFPCALLCLVFMCLCLVSCGEDENEQGQLVSGQKNPLLVHGIVADISGEGAADLAKIFLDMHQDIIGTVWSDMKDDLQRKFDQNNVPLTVDEYAQKYIWQEGEFLITPMDDHYKVEFPSKTVFVLPEEGGGAEDINDPALTRVEITHISGMDVRPTGDPHAWRYKITPVQEPVSITVVQNGVPYEVLSINVDVKKSEGLWHTQLQRPVQVDSKALNFEMKLSWPLELAFGKMEERLLKTGEESLELAMTAGVLENIGQMEPDENNQWSGTINSNATNIAVALPSGLGSFTAYSMDVTQTADHLDPSSYAVFHEGYQDFLKFLRNHPPATSPASTQDDGALENTAAAKEAARDFLDDLSVFLQNGLQGMEAIIDVKDLRFLAPADPASPDNRAPAFEVDRVRMASRASGLQSDAAIIGAEYQIKGFSVDPAILNKMPTAASIPVELYPKNIQVGGYIENVPVQKFLAALNDHLDSLSVMSSPTVEGEPMPMDGTSPQPSFGLDPDWVLRLLAESGASIHIDQNYIGNDIWLISANGRADVNPAAAYDMTGELDIRMYGTDTLLGALNKRAGAEQDILMQKTLRGTLSALSFLQAFGQQKEDAQNRPYRGYMLNVTEDGKVQLNGVDMQQMIGNAGALRPSSPPLQTTPPAQ